ncbi:STM3941 family protein [Brachyspira intermedia]|uniref:STM3941 family protein n=1 Tax=Brachyspira intermedia TaxID=84377 RepID=UPI00260B32E3|nr:STM3941 family protein [uncultured Brachyspira sp.]
MNEELNDKELNNNDTLINNDKSFPEIEIYVNKRKLSILIFVSLIFIVMGIFIFVNRKEFKEEVISIFILILFSICLLTFIIQWLKSIKPIITLDENGIAYYVLLKNQNIFIKWADIREILFSKTFIYIYLKEENSLLENKKNNDEPIVIYISEINMKRNTLIYLITHYFENKK